MWPNFLDVVYEEIDARNIGNIHIDSFLSCGTPRKGFAEGEIPQGELQASISVCASSMPKKDTHTLAFAVVVYKTETSIDIGLFFI